MMNSKDMTAARERMVKQQLRARGIHDHRVLSAMSVVPREEFVHRRIRDVAYADSPLPIAAGQTISQPYIVALMIEALELEGGERVLEIGTGSGYAAALLGQIAEEVDTIERIPELAEHAEQLLRSPRYRNVHVHCGDGTLGWPAKAPFDAIVVSAGGPQAPPSLQAQLVVGGRIVIPIGSDATNQHLVRITRQSQTQFITKRIAPVRFVPLIGDEGWKDVPQAKTISTRRSHLPRATEHPIRRIIGKFR